MEVIRLPGYLDVEKRIIAQRFIWPRQASRHGLGEGRVTLTDEAVEGVIHSYTREAGVRELERRLSRVARKLAREVAEDERPGVQPEPGAPPPSEPERVVEFGDLKAFLGPAPYLPRDREDASERTGMANGLAWTSVGGEVLDVEVAVVPGSGEVRLTGTLGDVMKESALAALTYARSRAARLGLDPQFHERVDIHIHIPEGATPKDGPSAGITIATALISALTGRPTHGNVAMTGEITLRGRVLPVGGIKEKAVAALRHGMDTVLIPAANVPELELLPDDVHAGLLFKAVRTMDEVLEAALVEPAGRTRAGASERAESSAGAGIEISQ
jgi:ATP-dependent Lon protease